MAHAFRASLAKETASYFDDMRVHFGSRLGTQSQLFRCGSTQPPPAATLIQPTTEVKVYSVDTLLCAGKMVQQGRNPLVLNFASEKKAGGGWFKGSLAQEESLMYRTTYGLSLDPKYNPQARRLYPIPADACIYSPDVFVMRDTEYTLLEYEHCYPVSFVAAAAPRRPTLSVNGTLTQIDATRTQLKMQLIFDVALLHGHDSLVLGAWGSGVFRCPPVDMARLFQKTLRQPQYAHRFKKVAFAVLGPPNDPNVVAYRSVFGQ